MEKTMDNFWKNYGKIPFSMIPEMKKKGMGVVRDFMNLEIPVSWRTRLRCVQSFPLKQMRVWYTQD